MRSQKGSSVNKVEILAINFMQELSGRPRLSLQIQQHSQFPKHDSSASLVKRCQKMISKNTPQWIEESS